MADSQKNNLQQSKNSCELYLFPEISCDTKKASSVSGNSEMFTQGAARNEKAPSPPVEDSHAPKMDEQAIQAAFNEGVDKGRNEVIASHREKVHQATIALTTVVEEMKRVRQRDVELMEIETVRLALAITKRIIGQEAENGKVIRQVVKLAMEKVSDQRQITLRLHPEDVETVKEFQGDLVSGDDMAAFLKIEADDAILRGGCIIETKLGDVDARIDQQMKVIEEMLDAQLPKTPAS